jgi:hypothetical protein
MSTPRPSHVRPGPGAVGLGVLNDLVRFVAELAIVVVFGWWGWSFPEPALLRVLLAVALPLAVCVVWALFGAPRRSMYRDSRWLPTAVLTFLTALAVLALLDLGRPLLAAVLAAVVVVTEIGVQLGLSPDRSGPGHAGTDPR